MPFSVTCAMSHFLISHTVKEPDPEKLQEGGLKEAISFLQVHALQATGTPTEIQSLEVSAGDRKEKFEKMADGGSSGKIIHGSC